MKKRILSILLILSMALSILPFGAFNLTASAAITAAGLEYTILSDEVEITGYIGSATEVVIPAEIEGYPVTSIGAHACENSTNLTIITIPDNVTKIGENAFHIFTVIRCKKDSAAANYCKKITEQPYVFIDTPDSENIFSGTFNDFNWNIDKRTGVLKINGSGNTLDFMFMPEYFLWSKYRCYITSVEFSNKITEIAEEAFCHCYNLKKIVIPDSVTYIGNNAFYGCYNLTSFTIPNNVTYIGHSVFKYCSNLTSVTIGESISKVQYCTFVGCSALEEIMIYSRNCEFEYDCGLNNNHTIYGFKGSNTETSAKKNCENFVDIMKVHTHTESTVKGYAATCTTTGLTAGKKCSICGVVTVKQTSVPANGHNLIILPAKTPTYTATGLTAGKKCSVCGTITLAQKVVAKLPQTSLKKAKFTLKAKTYTGKAIKQSFTVKLGSKTLKKGKDYTVSYKNNKKIGKATVTITGIGNYAGTKKVTFAINPKKVSSLKVKSGKKHMTVSWKKDKSVGGYDILYATSKNFKKGKKTVKVTKASTVKKVIKKLKAKKTYYVKVRAFKKVGGKTYYGAYASVKKVKIK